MQRAKAMACSMPKGNKPSSLEFGIVGTSAPCITMMEIS